MKAATSAMNLGRDRLALVVQGKIKSAPVVQAVISRTFEISGLDGKNEASGLAELLNRRASTEKNTPFIPQDLQALEAPGAPAGKNGRGRISVPGEFSHHFRRLRQACGARYGTSGKPGHHLERRSIP